MEKNPYKIGNIYLQNQMQYTLLEKNLDKINWSNLTLNPNDIELLKKILKKLIGIIYQEI